MCPSRKASANVAVASFVLPKTVTPLVSRSRRCTSPTSRGARQPEVGGDPCAVSAIGVAGERRLGGDEAGLGQLAEERVVLEEYRERDTRSWASVCAARSGSSKTTISITLAGGTQRLRGDLGTLGVEVDAARFDRPPRLSPGRWHPLGSGSGRGARPCRPPRQPRSRRFNAALFFFDDPLELLVLE